MTSRLDRLVTLLETGSTQLIRNTAAQQLADVQKKHPDELFNLLTRVVPYLKSKSWDTRTAAAKAVGGIVENAEKFDPNVGDAHNNGTAVKAETDDSEADESESSLPSPPEDQLSLETLDVAAILTHGKKLLGSAGKEYDYQFAAMDPTQRLNHQKKTLTARLGLAGEYMEEELLDESDFKQAPPDAAKRTPSLPRINTSVQASDSAQSASESRGSPHDAVSQTPLEDQGLSKRQINALKRKNKRDFKTQANKVRIVDFSQRRQSMDDSRPEPVALKTSALQEDEPNGTNGHSDYFSLDRKGEDDDTKFVKDFKGPAVPEKSDLVPEADEEGQEWPYERLCEFLMVDLFDHNWEIRHGAAMGLREVVRAHGAGAGRRRGKPCGANEALNQRWLDDLACRLCCVFMLDLFGDYVSDNVVAPIRETVGQTLGASLPFMTPSAVGRVYQVLNRLVMQTDLGLDRPIWQACHGGMIGMRYLVAVRSDLLLQESTLMDGVLEAVMKGLGDWDDDVRAVSAATLIPVSSEVITMNEKTLNKLISIVWDCLSNLSDDLSASTGSVMDLLAKLCSSPKVLDLMKVNAAQNPDNSFAELVPRLFPFLRHTITSVRSAVLRALLTFLDISGEGTSDWIDGKALRLVFQNLLVERNDGVVKISLEVWSTMLKVLTLNGSDELVAAFEPHVAPLLTLTLHPIGVPRHSLPMDPSLFIRPSGHTYSFPQHRIPRNSPGSVSEAAPKRRRRSERKEKEKEPAPPAAAHNIDAPMIQGDVELVGAEVMIRSKINAARALGQAMSLWPPSQLQSSFLAALTPSFSSPFSTTQSTACMIAEEYAKLENGNSEQRLQLSSALLPLVEGQRPLWYSDLVSYLQTTRAQCQSLLNTFRDDGHVSSSKLPTIAFLVQGEHDAGQYAFSIANGEQLVGTDFDRLKKSMIPIHRIAASKRLSEARDDAERALEEARTMKAQRDVRIKAAAAAALVAFTAIPKKPTSTIKGLMDSVKTEEMSDLQKRSAIAVVGLIKHMVSSGKRGVVDKVVGNLVKFSCMETAETPEFHPNAGIEVGILSLKKEEDVRDHADAAKFEREARAARIMRRGAKDALEQLAVGFGKDLLDQVPSLRALIESPLKKLTQVLDGDVEDDLKSPDSLLGQESIDAMSTIRALVASFHVDLYPVIISLVPDIIAALKSKLSVLRYTAAKSLATICSVITVEGFSILVEQVLPSIKNAHDAFQRQGVVECIYHLIHVMADSILPYVIFLIVPVLGRMSDSDNDVRLIATTTFATLVKLVPLEAGIPDPPGLSQELLQGRERERKFMSQMLDFKKLERFDIPVAIKATLRSYQQEGVDWLAFLNRYNLHGILCDDMGLGKTLQTLCIVASDHHMRAEEFAKSESLDVRQLPSLIVCPPTLSGHWQQEIRAYAPFLSSVAYVGPPAERQKLRSKLRSADVVITSYENCRNDIDILAPMNWNYCVLDEGHLIKNPAAKTTQAVKRLASNHRLILSGTPIQNNVLEMWSLFDFLMPGFLGTEKVFKDRFARPIAASRFSRSSSREQEAGALAAESLHKQVLPFLMRRLKEEVLDDLPPKILQNYYCDLSELQRKLFEDFTKKQGSALGQLATAGDKESKQHIFAALNYMRKLCNSPALVVKEGSEQFGGIQKYLTQQRTTLRDVVHAPKLTALHDLLVDLGIGTDAPSNSTAEDQQVLASSTDAVSPHRALIFCQMKEMLDMVESDVLREMLPSVQSLRLDGSVEASHRQDIVNKFNSDPSYDVLLLTTSVGGLGLNLTGADTVIFVEHDWNPQKDIQAMDRAHRIGQKKVVNVFRLITRGTLEEKILNLQRFKIDVASQVVNQQNAGLASMQTDQILDLFNLGETADADGDGKNGDGDGENAVDAVTGQVKEKGKKGFLDDMGELWDESQYEEFDMDGFLQKVKA